MKKQFMSKRITSFILLLLLAGVILLYPRTRPVSTQARDAYQTMAQHIRDNTVYYAVRPPGEVTGGVIIYPDDQEDPVSYAPLARTLSEEGLEVRVVKYPMGKASLFKADPVKLLGEATQLAWISVGLGSGATKACSIADKSEAVAGLILIGVCSSDVNLNDNDLMVTVYQLDNELLDDETLASMKKKLPADSRYLAAATRDEVLGGFLDSGSRALLIREEAFLTQVQRILAAKTPDPKNQK